MALPQIRFDSRAVNFKRRAARLSVMAVLILGTSFSATAATAAAAGAADSSNPDTRYQAERAVCERGLSNQDRATCLREAGAALQASKERRLNDDPGAYHRNASLRCNVLPADDRDACQRRMAGEGTTSGSVGSGGVIRELVIPDNK